MANTDLGRSPRRQRVTWVTMPCALIVAEVPSANCMPAPFSPTVEWVAGPSAASGSATVMPALAPFDGRGDGTRTRCRRYRKFKGVLRNHLPHKSLPRPEVALDRNRHSRSDPRCRLQWWREAIAAPRGGLDEFDTRTTWARSAACAIQTGFGEGCCMSVSALRSYICRGNLETILPMPYGAG